MYISVIRVLQLQTRLGEVASAESANDRTAAERVGEFLIESREEILISGFGKIREIDFNPCLF